MSQKPVTQRAAAEKVVKEVRRATRKCPASAPMERFELIEQQRGSGSS
jgi:hypothetical protein